MAEDMRIIKTRIALKKAIISLLENDNIDKITVSTICKVADVNRVTFYSHYQDKFDLFTAVIDDFTNDIFESIKIDRLANLSKEEIIKVLMQIVYLLSEGLHKYENIYRHISTNDNSAINFIVSTKCIDMTTKILNILCKDRPTSFPIEIISSFIIGGFAQTIQLEIKDPTNFSSEKVTEYASMCIKRLVDTDFLF